MDYKNDLSLHNIDYYTNIADEGIKYYKSVISEYKKENFYLGLFIAMKFKEIITKKDENEIEIFYNALKSNLGKQGTQWDNMFFAFENWRYNYIIKK